MSGDPVLARISEGADGHRRLGDPVLAREHLERARERIGALGGDDYGRLIRSGLERVEADLFKTAPPADG